MGLLWLHHWEILLTNEGCAISSAQENEVCAVDGVDNSAKVNDSSKDYNEDAIIIRTYSDTPNQEVKFI